MNNNNLVSLFEFSLHFVLHHSDFGNYLQRSKNLNFVKGNQEGDELKKDPS